MKRLIGLAVIGLFLWQPSLFAAVLVMDLKFSGINWEEEGASAGATVRLSFATLTDSDPNSNVGSYSATVTLLSGGSAAQALGASVITIKNDVSGADVFDMSEASFPSPFVDVDGQSVSAVSFTLTSSKADMFSSDALPLDPNFASKADSVLLILTHGDTPRSFPTNPPGVVISSAVPEPSSYVLLAAGILSLVAVGRLRRR